MVWGFFWEIWSELRKNLCQTRFIFRGRWSLEIYLYFLRFSRASRTNLCETNPDGIYFQTYYLLLPVVKLLGFDDGMMSGKSSGESSGCPLKTLTLHRLLLADGIPPTPTRGSGPNRPSECHNMRIGQSSLPLLSQTVFLCLRSSYDMHEVGHVGFIFRILNVKCWPLNFSVSFNQKLHSLCR